MRALAKSKKFIPIAITISTFLKKQVDKENIISNNRIKLSIIKETAENYTIIYNNTIKGKIVSHGYDGKSDLFVRQFDIPSKYEKKL